jgi:hypothetical protein
MRNCDLVSLVAMASSLVACSSSSPQAPDAATDSATDAAWITGNGLVLEDTTTTPTPLPGARVCILDHAEIPCATTDATGVYTLAVPPTLHDVDFAVNVTAAAHLGFTGLLAKGAIPERWYSRIAVNIPDAYATQRLLGPWGFGSPIPNTGLVEIFVGDSRVGGGVPGITVYSPQAQAVYMNAAGDPDRLLTATTTNGRVVFGNVAPGKLEIAIGGAPCVVSTGRDGGWDTAWHTANASTIAGEVAADSLTLMSVYCN